MLQAPTVLPVNNLTGNDVVNIDGEKLGSIASATASAWSGAE